MIRIRGFKAKDRPAGKRADDDILLCQFLSGFLWIFIVFIINFFLLHRPNTIPQAEAHLMEQPMPPRPPDLAPPLPTKLAMLSPQKLQEMREKMLEDDYKPNYYFLYKDQIRFVDVLPKKKVMITKKTVPAPVPVEKKEEPKPEVQKQRVIQLEWLDMEMMEEPPPEKEIPLERKKKQEVRQAIKVAMVTDLDMDLEIKQDVPTPILREQPKPKKVEQVTQVPMVLQNLDMEIMDQEEPEKPVQKVPHIKQAKAQPMVVSTSADYVSLSMEIPTETRAGPPSKTPVSAKGKPSSRPLLMASGNTALQADIPMALDVGTNAVKASGPPVKSSGKGKAKTGGLVASKGVGGIEMSSGILVGGEWGRGGEKPAAQPSTAPATVRMIQRSANGSIPLGRPLSFRLADVGSETQSGSAYLRTSTMLKRYLDAKHLSSQPVTVSVNPGAGRKIGSEDLVGVSYSSSQVVLQYASGKQQVVSLVKGEPFPKFELRRASQGSGTVSVGTKLDEIDSCLNTLQRVLEGTH